jgi:hypothetical protein
VWQQQAVTPVTVLLQRHLLQRRLLLGRLLLGRLLLLMLQQQWAQTRALQAAVRQQQAGSSSSRML